MNPTDTAVIILAAGKGTRMKSELPKVLHPLAGKPMLWHVLNAAQSLNPIRTVVITGYGAEDVETFSTKNFPGTQFARQTEQKGTGHAVMQARALLGRYTGPIVILYGDIMLSARTGTLTTLMQAYAKTPAGLSLLTAQVDNPTGFGRLLEQNGILVNIEEKDCTPEQRAITTVNPCIYALGGQLLWQLLDNVTDNNAQHEYYLTDIIALAQQSGHPVTATAVPAERSEVGINTPEELAAAEQTFLQRQSK